MKLKFQYGSNGPIGRQLAAWQNSLFPGYVSFRRLQFHHQNRLIISLINKGANTWIITQPPYSHNFCRSKTAINNRELLYCLSLMKIQVPADSGYLANMLHAKITSAEAYMESARAGSRKRKGLQHKGPLRGGHSTSVRDGRNIPNVSWLCHNFRF